jgi:hypothetical protein
MSIEQAMQCVFGQLSEHGRRLYAAVEAQKLSREPAVRGSKWSYGRRSCGAEV